MFSTVQYCMGGICSPVAEVLDYGPRIQDFSRTSSRNVFFFQGTLKSTSKLSFCPSEDTLAVNPYPLKLKIRTCPMCPCIKPLVLGNQLGLPY